MNSKTPLTSSLICGREKPSEMNVLGTETSVLTNTSNAPEISSYLGLPAEYMSIILYKNHSVRSLLHSARQNNSSSD